MDREEFERIKQAEKAHLRAMRDLKRAAREAARTRRVADAVDGIVHESRDVLDAHDEALERVALDTARAEARWEVAAEFADAADQRAQEADDEEALQHDRARRLVEQMRALQTPPPAPVPSLSPSRPTPPDAEADPETGTDSDDDAPAPLPEKTLGRMRR